MTVCRAHRRTGHRAATGWVDKATAVGLLVGASLLLAAGEAAPTLAAPNLQVEAVDDAAFPAVSVVVSAPGLESEEPVPAFRVTEDGVALAVQAAAVPPRAVEVVLVVAEPAEGTDPAETRSALLDLVLRLPPDAQVSIIATAPRPEVLAGPANTLQTRVLAANEVSGGEPLLDEALDLALEQFSEADGRVRRLVVVGGDGERGTVPQEQSELLAERDAALHTVEPGSPAVDQLVARLSNLYRLEFEVGEGTDEVEVQVAEGDQQAAVTVAFADGGPRGAGSGGGDETRTGTSAPGRPAWPAVLLSLVAILGIVLLSASIVVPSPAMRRHEPGPGAWERTAARVAGEIGAEEAVSGAAEWIVRQRRESASEIWAAGREPRLAATVLAVQPVVVGALAFLAGRGEGLVVGGSWRTAALVVALLLTVVGAAWLRRVARPPFSAWPPRWRQHAGRTATLQRTADTLDLAHLYAAGGLPLEESLARGGAGLHEDPTRLLERARSGDTGGASPAELLAAASTAVRSDQVTTARERARGGITATAVPFLACILPATILVLVAALPGLAAA